MKNVLLGSLVPVSLIILASNIFNPAKEKPEHIGINEVFVPIVKEYKDLAKKKSINFTKSITIGFKKLREGEEEEFFVGMCNYSPKFREIDIDKGFWKTSTKTTKRTLLFHELTHCLCERMHDYGDGERYKEARIPKIFQDALEDRRPFFIPEPGFHFDGCPLSIMYPYVVNDSCVKDHQEEYDDEMFNRCKPY